MAVELKTRLDSLGTSRAEHWGSVSFVRQTTTRLVHLTQQASRLEQKHIILGSAVSDGGSIITCSTWWSAQKLC